VAGRPDVLVVGGGILGLGTALELLRLGRRPRVIERGEPGQEASGRGAGILSPAGAQVDGDPMSALRRLSRAQWSVWRPELEDGGHSIGYVASGGLTLAADPAAAEALRARSAEAARAEPGAVFWGPAVLRREEPLLSERIAGALFHPEEHQVENRLVMAALERRVRHLGGVLTANTPVVSLLRRGDRVTGVHVADGTAIEAEAVVVAAGAWSAPLLGGIGVRLPVRPVKGEILSVRAPGRLRFVASGRDGFYSAPKQDGRVLIGATEVEGGFDPAVTVGGLAKLTAFALEMYPRIGDLPVERSWSGFRPALPDGLPALGGGGMPDGLLVATGHFRSGVLLAPGSARVVAELAVGRPAREVLAALAPGRFAPAAASPPRAG
jgi:glycine oxidase